MPVAAEGLLRGGRPLIVLAAAAQRDQAADGEADDRRPDRQLALVVANLAAPVGELGHAAAKRLDRSAQLGALVLDVRPGSGPSFARQRGAPADGRAGRRRSRRPPGARSPRAGLQRLLGAAASSIARSGVGGAPACTDRYANKPAPAATQNQNSASIMKPIQTWSEKKRSLSSQAMPCMSIASPMSANTPAAIPTTDPWRSLETFSRISVLASSISSRTRIETRSETSKTSSPTDLSSGRRLRGCSRGALGAHSGGSSPNTRPRSRPPPGSPPRSRARVAGDEPGPEQSSEDVVLHVRYLAPE